MVSRGAQKIVYVAVTISKPTSLGTLEVREVCPVGRVTYRVCQLSCFNEHLSLSSVKRMLTLVIYRRKLQVKSVGERGTV